MDIVLHEELMERIQSYCNERNMDVKEFLNDAIIEKLELANKERRKKPRLQALSTKEEMSKIYSKVGYCDCGYEIWIEYLPSVDKWIYRFFDMDHNEITECPVCGNKITEDDLKSM